MSLADYSCENASELHLILRVEEDDTSVDREAEQQTARVRAELVGKRLADFIVSKKIGGKDIAAVGGGGAAQSISQSGVCSYVYLAVLRGARGSGEPVMQFAIKVMLNYEEGMGNSVALRQEFDAETALLSDPERLPAHRHVMVVLHSFTDTATGLPSWNFEADIVNPRTMFVVMPYYPDDLKRVLRVARREGSRVFGALRAVSARGPGSTGAQHRCSSVSPSSCSSDAPMAVSDSFPPTTFSFTALAAAPRRADARAAASFVSSASTAAAAHSFAATIGCSSRRARLARVLRAETADTRVRHETPHAHAIPLSCTQSLGGPRCCSELARISLELARISLELARISLELDGVRAQRLVALVPATLTSSW